MKGLAVLVLRYKKPGEREFRVPLNLRIGGVEIPLGVALITLALFALCVINLFTKQVATVSGAAFTLIFFAVFEISEKVTKSKTTTHAELDKFNLAQAGDLTPENVGVKPGNVLVPVSTYYALYPLEAALQRVRRREAEIVVLHVRMLRRAASGEYDLAPDQLFTSIEQMLFTKVLAMAEKEGKPVRLVVAAANDLWEGILRTADNLQSSTVVAGSSSKASVTEQAREIGIAWEHMPEPRPRVTLELFTPLRQRAGLLPRSARAALDAQGDRPAAQSMAGICREPAGRGNPPPRYRPLRARRGRAGDRRGAGRRRPRTVARPSARD